MQSDTLTIHSKTVNIRPRRMSTAREPATGGADSPGMPTDNNDMLLSRGTVHIWRFSNQ